jgi:SAM-dependent methyltransferase
MLVAPVAERLDSRRSLAGCCGPRDPAYIIIIVFNIMDDLPLPPAELARRVGVLDQEDPVGSFHAMGAEIHRTILDLQGSDWFTGGKRVLDFGCGSGKLLRHFLKEAKECEFIGCDIDEPSINWLQEHFTPPLTVFTCGEEPGLPLPDEHIDLALAMSVFTHLTEHWAGWLLEIHRVLRPGGRLICTFLGHGMSEAIAGEPWDANRIGMNILRLWQPWDHGGPSVQHSEWWLRAHWGRAFEFERVEDSGEFGHGLLVLRKREVELTDEDLRAPEPGEPREITSLLHNVTQLAAETNLLATDREAVMHELEAVRTDRERVMTQLDAVYADREHITQQYDALSMAQNRTPTSKQLAWELLRRVRRKAHSLRIKDGRTGLR